MNLRAVASGVLSFVHHPASGAARSAERAGALAGRQEFHVTHPAIQAAMQIGARRTANPVLDAARGSGYVHAGPTGRYLQRADGRPFFSIGNTEGFGFFFQKMNSPQLQDAYMANMRAHGRNTISVQIESEIPDFFGGNKLNLEMPLGVFDESIAQQFDEFLDIAAKNDVHVITYPWDSFTMGHVPEKGLGWDRSPWNKANPANAALPKEQQGMLEFASDMLRDPRAREFQKQKIDWIMARYGDHPSLLGIDLMNEIELGIAGAVEGNRIPAGSKAKGVWLRDPLNGGAMTQYRVASEREIKAWVDDITSHAKKSWEYYWGVPELGKPGVLGLGHRRPHLTVSTNNPDHVGRGMWQHRHPDLDMATYHLYSPLNRGEISDPPSRRALADAVKRITDINAGRLSRRHPRPMLDTENGAIDHFHRTQKAHPDIRAHAKLTAWFQSTSGAAGGGLRWPYPNMGFEGSPFLNPMTPEMDRDLLALSKVAGAVDWNSLSPQRAGRGFTPKSATLSSAARDEHQLMGFIWNDVAPGTAPRSTSVRFKGFADEAHEVLWFDTASGDVLHREAAHGTRFQLDTPEFVEDVAVVVRPARRAATAGS